VRANKKTKRDLSLLPKKHY